jgi:hypothetical protein
MQLIVWMQSQKARPRAGVQLSQTMLLSIRAFIVVMLGVTLSRIPMLMAAWAAISTSPIFAHLKEVQMFLGPLARVLGVM